MLRKVIVCGLVLIAIAALLGMASQSPAIQADVFDSPIAPEAFLPIVQAGTFESPLVPHNVYLPFVARDWLSAVRALAEDATGR